MNWFWRLLSPRPLIEDRVPLVGTVEATVAAWLADRPHLCPGDVDTEIDGAEVVIRVWTVDPFAPEG